MPRTPDSYVGLLFRRGGDLSSYCIARFGSALPLWSHVDVVASSGWLVGARSDRIRYWGTAAPHLRGTILKAGVQVRPPDYQTPLDCSRIGWPCTAETLTASFKFLEKNIGRRYDMSAIWGFILQRALHHAGRDICSEFAAEWMHKVIHAKVPVPAYQCSPNQLYFAAWGAGARPY